MRRANSCPNSDADWKRRRLKSLKSDHKWDDFDDKYIVYQVKDYFSEYVNQLSDTDRQKLIAELDCEVVAFKKGQGQSPWIR